ncbi:DUF3375 domain-containing protein [Vibrio breoganii]|uniref:DUF3375 domain-containing protein n=1 Tax=Vibrio breoganii TaxID=553239 RepID=UPI000C837683|nr:DUF3375 domain-containing protein [Vibrio breoganii]PMK37614.1 hypothetical protein BCU00_04065 [Vibrio breoganii]
MVQLSFQYLEQLKEDSTALRLLRSPHFPLIGSFFHQTFLETNRRSISYQELATLLDYYLSDLADIYGNDKYPKSAQAYLEDWVNVKGGYLRKYLPHQGDEIECDLLPDVEKALRWIEDMQGSGFVGTESRLKLLMDTIADLVHGTSEDKQSKLVTLKAKKAELEKQIQAVELGMDVGYSGSQVREKMFLISNMSRQLLGDFRQVEANFRYLDKETRKKITQTNLHKGGMLDEVFGDQDVIDGSDEGKSFSAFFEILMRGDMRDSLRQDLKSLLKLDGGLEFGTNDELLQHLYSYLLDAGTKVNRTKQQITDQLKRYIQEQSQDNKRILELIRDFEMHTHRSIENEQQQEKEFYHIDSFQAAISALTSRSLYQPAVIEALDSHIVEEREDPNVDLSRLFEVSRIDEYALQRQIQQCLQNPSGQATLAQVIEQFPIQYGLDEMLTYVKIACEQGVPASIDEQQQQHIEWQAHDGSTRRFTLPLITFVREL